MDKCSAVKFENYLGQLKTLVHHGKHVLQQIYARLEEQFYTCDQSNIKLNKLIITSMSSLARCHRHRRSVSNVHLICTELPMSPSLLLTVEII